MNYLMMKNAYLFYKIFKDIIINSSTIATKIYSCKLFLLFNVELINKKN